MLQAALSLLAVSVACAPDVNGNDSTATVLNEAVVTARSSKTFSLGDGDETVLNTDAIGRMIRSLGEADPLLYLKMSAGVSTGSDYSSGLSVQGSSFSQTLFKAGNLPIFFPYHFGGIFSAFISSHYPYSAMSKAIHPASFPSRTGGSVEVREAETTATRLHAYLNLGMTASSLHLRTPLGQRFEIALSGRISYLERLYKPLLDLGDQVLSYSFADAALTASYHVSDSDRLTLRGHFNTDRLGIDDRTFLLDTRMDWRNAAASLQWVHKGKVPFQTDLIWSHFNNDMRTILPGFDLTVPSAISQYGVSAQCDVPLRGHRPLSVGMEASWYRCRPQAPEESTTLAKATEGRVYVSHSLSLPPYFSLDYGLKASGFISEGYRTGCVSPVATVSYRNGRNRFSLHSALYPQYLHQAGFAEIGLSSNFWFPASKRVPAQLAWSIAAAYRRSFPFAGLTVSIEPYYKRVLRQPEYEGIILDLLDADYDPESHIISTHGFNAGADVSVSGAYGPLFAKVAYSLGFARRRFPDAPHSWLPASTESLHSLNALASVAIGRGWRLSATFSLASGRPYTPIKQMYMIGENTVAVYGRRNSARMPLYHRLDLSGAYTFSTGGRLQLRHTLVISIINAYARRNAELAYYRYNPEKGTFYFHTAASLYRFLPSLSYSIEL